VHLNTLIRFFRFGINHLLPLFSILVEKVSLWCVLNEGLTRKFVLLLMCTQNVTLGERGGFGRLYLCQNGDLEVVFGVLLETLMRWLLRTK
jgi:hypothetical protein